MPAYALGQAQRQRKGLIAFARPPYQSLLWGLQKPVLPTILYIKYSRTAVYKISFHTLPMFEVKVENLMRVCEREIINQVKYFLSVLTQT